MLNALIFVLLFLLGMLLLAPYVVYPILLLLFPKEKYQKPFSSNKIGKLPLVSVLIPAHNESEHIRAKIVNTLNLDYPADRLEIIVCSDGSTDETYEIGQEFIDRGVQIYRNARRRGKAVTINRLVRISKGELLLLTDVGAMLTPNALKNLTAAFSDSELGAAGARYQIQRNSEKTDTEEGYWSLDSRIKMMEAERGMLLGLHGAAFMFRRNLVESLRHDAINDDFIIPLRIRAKGYRILYLPEVVATEPPTNSWKTVFRRLVRISRGNFQMFWRFRRHFKPANGRVALAFVHRKLLKSLGPLFIIALTGISTWAADRHIVFLTLACMVWLAILQGCAGLLFRWAGMKGFLPVRILAYGLMAQVATLIGMVQWAIGFNPQWRRAPENEPLSLVAQAKPPLYILIIKRLLDVTMALIGLALCSPIFLALPILIRLESPGPAIFRQSRIRFDSKGRPVTFTMFKFRSMAENSEAASGPVWASKHDPRITPIGNLIRKTRMDELPQLFNVLRGNMSLVGPRPERPQFVEVLEKEIPLYTDRVCWLKPGITGWAQVNLEYDSSIEDVRNKMLFDLAYAAHQYKLSHFLLMEFKVLASTVRVIFLGKGAH